MAEDNELEKLAVEELLRETSRARIRAETMGPAGWLKCPLRSTNKRFLLNTLRSTSLQRRSGEPQPGQSATGGRLRSESPDRSRDRSRSPPREEHRNKRDHTTGHKHHHRHSHKRKDKKPDRDKDRHHRRKEDGERRREDGQKKDRDRHKVTE